MGLINKISKLPVPAILIIMIFLGCNNQEIADEQNRQSENEYTQIGNQKSPGEYDTTSQMVSQDDEQLDWCYEHSVPESQCTQCNPNLIAGFKKSGDWCAGCGLPESHCRICNPEIMFPQEIVIKERKANSSRADKQEYEQLDWCYEHSVPESQCTQCNPNLIAGFKQSGDWCAGCGLPESHCRICNPEIMFPQEIIIKEREANSSRADKQEYEQLDWCYEHSVPESQCTQCRPDLIAGFKQSGDWCPPHDLPESHCRLCNPGIEFPQEVLIRERLITSAQNEIEVSLFFRPNANKCATDGALIQFASNETVERAGISVQTVRKANYSNVIEAPAEVVFDETKTLVISTTVSALVSRWLVSPGDAVDHGEPIAILQAPEIAGLKSSLISKHSDYELERKELERHMEMKQRNLISTVDFDRQVALTEKAQAELTSARGMLLATGLDESDIDYVISNNSVSNQFTLRAGSAGVIAVRIAKLGRLYGAGEALAMVADPEAIWIEAQLSEVKLKAVAPGQELIYTSDDRSMNRAGGKIIWVSDFLDQHTRTGTVRARVVDRNHGLSTGEFGRVKIFKKDNENAVLVPKDAVQWEGCCNVVFVQETLDRYRPRKVELVDSDGPFYQALGGIGAGERVVVDGSFLLKTELKKSSIGAGCCGLEPLG
ncbi:MAG: efflux RND transporter periplasmic adaptor subunit [candidate division Zixibacteria bacterium]|nr:efflux RND transporter periplasmic adaptor subunit [candidate division Zixibacteria bacterium]